MELNAVKELPRKDIVKEWWAEVKENSWEQDSRLHPRNGYYRRSLVTHLGLIQAIRVPRLRKGSFHTQVFRRYHRCEQLVENLIRDSFLAGVSTRRVGAVVSALLETKVSSSSVSRITRSLDMHVQRFHQRPLLDEFQYLILDGIRLKVRYNGTYRTRTVLVAYGITLFGRKILIDFQSAWEALLNSLYQRGLQGQNLKLIVMDGSAGLRAAAEVVYPQAKIQRCWVHKLRNVANLCPKKHHACVRQAGKIHLSANRAAALQAFQRWKFAWLPTCPRAVACLQRDLDEILNFFDSPIPHRIKVRTTNAIERSFREVRRRTNVFSCFSNTNSTDRIIYAIFTHLNTSWIDRPLHGFTQF